MRGASESDTPGESEEGRLREVFSCIGFYCCPEIAFGGDIETALNVDHTKRFSGESISESVPKVATAEGNMCFEVFQLFVPEDFGYAQIGDIGSVSLPIIANSYGIPDPDGPVRMEPEPRPYTKEIHQTAIPRKKLTAQ